MGRVPGQHKGALPTVRAFQSAVVRWTSKSDLPPLPPEEIDAKMRQSLLREWKNDREVQDLEKLGYALGVGKIILADSDIVEDMNGQYYCARRDPLKQFKFRVTGGYEKSLNLWKLSRKQRATINRTFRSGRDVILVAYQASGDFPATLAHELGHYINHTLWGLSRVEAKLPGECFPVTQNMRRVARFDEAHLLKNRDEFYAETWSRFLCGGGSRTLLRYLQRPLGRLRTRHPEKARLIERHRIKAIREKRNWLNTRGVVNDEQPGIADCG